jgi:hypothetical protein
MEPAPREYRIAHHEPVRDFRLDNEKKEISFSAYGETWRFSVWLSDLKEKNEHHFYARFVDQKRSDKLSGFTVAPGHIVGQIVLPNDTLWLEARDPNQAHELFVYRQSQLSSPVELLPNLNSLQVPGIDQAAKRETEERISAYVIRVYYDQDWIVGPWGAWAAMVGLIHDVNVAYANAGLHGFNVEGNYGGGVYNPYGDTYAMLQMIGNVANSQPGYNLYAYMVGRNLGGIAWVGTACNPGYGWYYRTSVNGMVNWSRLFTVKTLAHETGHNRGANHDFVNQCSSNNQPGCQCSIMSYCFPQAGYHYPEANLYSGTSLNEMVRAGCY